MLGVEVTNITEEGFEMPVNNIFNGLSWHQDNKGHVVSSPTVLSMPLIKGDARKIGIDGSRVTFDQVTSHRRSIVLHNPEDIEQLENSLKESGRTIEGRTSESDQLTFS